MKKKEKLTLHGYRISKEHDKKVKQKAKEHGSESAYIRHLIEKDGVRTCRHEEVCTCEDTNQLNAEIRYPKLNAPDLTL
jgi:hypothetical protein